MSKYIYKGIYVLFYGTPIFYMIAALYHNQSLYIIKDIMMIIIAIFIIAYNIRKKGKLAVKNFSFIFLYFFYILISSLINFEDFLFWAIGLREIVVTPILLLLIGSFFAEKNINYFAFIKKSLFFSTIATILFCIFFPSLSFGLTNRLSSFWDSEHEPGIISSLYLILCISEEHYYKDRNYSKIIIPFILFLMCAILSKSRITFLSLFFSIIYILGQTLTRRNLFVMLFITIAFLIFALNYDTIMDRSLGHNLDRRTIQYELAKNLIIENPFLGIGIDKYGIVGHLAKRLEYGNTYTITMDSSIIKYALNVGGVFILLFFVLIKKTYISMKNKSYATFFSIIVFCLMYAFFTGKLGAYPMNQYFYSLIGFALLRQN